MVLFKISVAGAVLFVAGLVLLTVAGQYVTVPVQTVQRNDVEQLTQFTVGDITDRSYSLPGGVSAFGSLNVTQLPTNQLGDINFTILDAGNYQKWSSGQQSNSLLSKDEQGQSTFTFTTTTNGPYYFVFDDRASPYKKAVAFSLSYNELSTSYVTDPRVPYIGWGFVAAGLIVLAIGLIRKPPVTWA